ncbi:MAG: periplasmic heavy metal sensor [Calditrichia bacterium]
MKIKLLIGILIFLIVVNLATIGTYLFYRFDGGPGPGFNGPPPRGQMDRPRFPRSMNKEKHKQLMDRARAFRESIHSIHESIRSDERKLKDVLLAETADRQMADSLLMEISDKKLKIQEKAIIDFIEAKEFLTLDEQRVLSSILFRTGPDDRGRKKRRRR